MKEETRTLVNYRLERAKESIEEAKILVERGHINTFINRLYYASFYAVSALLLAKGLSSPKHSGVRSLFHQNFVKSGVIDIESGRFFDKLFDNRQKADYSDLLMKYIIGMVKLRNLLLRSKRFICVWNAKPRLARDERM